MRPIFRDRGKSLTPLLFGAGVDLGGRAAIVRKVIRRAFDRPEAIIAPLVDAVMAGPTEHDTVIDVVCPAPFNVPDVVRLYRFTEPVLSLSGYT
jgi:hypothetical protein